MSTLQVIVGTAVAVGLALTVGIACRARGAAESEQGPLELRALLSSATSGIDEQKLVVVRDAAAWQTLWQEHDRLQLPASSAPEVDFDREMAVAVFLGTRPSGGYAVQIESVDRGPGGLVVRALETAPAPDSATTQALTSPVHAVAVPRSDEHVRLDLRTAP